MTLLLIVGIACLLLGFLIGQLIRTTKVRQKNQEIEQEENQIRLAIKDAEREYDNLNNKFIQEQQKQEQILKEDYQKWETQKNQTSISLLETQSKLKEDIASLNTEIEEKKKSILDLETQAINAANSLEAKVYDLMSTEFAQKADDEINHCKFLSAQAQQEYESMMEELMLTYTAKRDELIEDYNRIAKQLHEAQAKANAAVEANKRAELERQEKDFYRLQLSDIDLEEIKRIKSIEPYLRKKEPLNKVVWKVYYEKPYTDLIGRVVGQGRKTGIYKITNIENGMCYVGQAVDIAERWKQHIKRGIGADPPTQNKLYPAMLTIGVENFTFEIIEQCDGKMLNEREDYWQTFYHAKDFGYSIK